MLIDSLQFHIKIFVTKGNLFRASITSIDVQSGERLRVEEVTVGGKKWKESRFDEHRLIIKKKCENLVRYLNKQIEGI